MFTAEASNQQGLYITMIEKHGAEPKSSFMISIQLRAIAIEITFVHISSARFNALSPHVDRISCGDVYRFQRNTNNTKKFKSTRKQQCTPYVHTDICPHEYIWNDHCDPDRDKNGTKIRSQRGRRPAAVDLNSCYRLLLNMNTSWKIVLSILPLPATSSHSIEIDLFSMTIIRCNEMLYYVIRVGNKRPYKLQVHFVNASINWCTGTDGPGRDAFN